MATIPIKSSSPLLGNPLLIKITMCEIQCTSTIAGILIFDHFRTQSETELKMFARVEEWRVAVKTITVYEYVYNKSFARFMPGSRSVCSLLSLAAYISVRRSNLNGFGYYT